jgi:hypothetical protein
VSSGWARAALSHRICTGLPRRKLGKMIEELAQPWLAQQESRLRDRRGRDRLRAEGAGPGHELPFADRVIATLVILRYLLPHAALAAARGVKLRIDGGCDQPAAGCEAHHVIHRADGGRTSLANPKDYCWWHHHVVLHQLGWTLTAHPDGTSQVTSPDGKTIRSHSPPPRPG